MDHRGSPVSLERGLLHLWKTGGSTEELCPDRVLLPRPVLQAALGTCHVVVLAQGGLVYSFGQMPWRCSQPVPASCPQVERSLLGQTVVRVAAGDLHCGAITQQGALYMWGDNSAGQCGLTGQREESPDFVPEPAAVTMLDAELVPPATVRVVELACGREHTLALSAQHELWAWGTGCQLGLVTSCFPVRKPQKVEHLAGRHVIQVVCGSYHSLALVRHLTTQTYNTQNTSEQCGRGQPEIPKPEREEAVVVDHTQYCPLGVELAGTTPGKGCSRQSSPLRRLSSKGTFAAAHPGSGSSPCPNSEGLKLGPSTGNINSTTQAQPDPDRDADPLTQTDGSPKACPLARNSKKTAFPDEVAIRTFLQKLSSKSLEVDDVSRDTDAGETDSLSSQMSEPSTEFSGSSYEDDPAVNRHTHLDSCDSTVCSSALCVDDVFVHVAAKRSPRSAHVSVENSRLKRRHAPPTPPSHGSPGCRGSPIGRPAPPSAGQGTHATGGPEDELPCLDTEVWSWGRGAEGQLGHGDQLDRLQPLCVKSLTGGQVVKLTAGSHHSLALTVLCQVYSWGSNTCGQLGHVSTPFTIPQQVKLSDGVRVWDVSAGQSHTLLLADGDCVQPIIYCCGQKQESRPVQTPSRGQRSPSRAETFTVRPLLLPVSMEMGYVGSVCSGGLSCAALADQNIMGFISTLHDLASRERLAYCNTHAIHTHFLKPLVDRENGCSSCLGKQCGHLFRSLSENFIRLSVLTGRHSVSLNNVLRDAQCRDVTSLPLVMHRSHFLEAYKEYCSAVGDFHVMSGFQSLTKLAAQCFGQRLDGILKLCGVDQSAPGDMLVNMMYQPIRHLNQYSTSLLKLATCYDPCTTEYMHLYQSYQQLDSVSRSLCRRQKDAERTSVFWENHSTKAVGALRRPERRLVCDSSNRSLTLLNTGIFSTNTFILFNDVLVQMQFSTYRVFPLTCLWVKPVSEDNTGVNGIKVICPEETFTLVASTPQKKNTWLGCLRQAIEQALGGGSGAEVWSGGTGVAALCRTASYTFSGEGSLKDAHYSGTWLAGKPHGRGTLTWPDGRRYTGNFKNGCVDGYGECEIPSRLNKPDYYQGHWKDDKIHGFGKYKYASGELYEGCFYDGQRHGYGMLSSGRLGKTSSSIFIGQWVHDKKTGYGVLHDITRGDKYLGLWQDDQRQGEAVVITQAGLYFEGTFKDNRMTGTGLLVTEDNTSWQGEFSDDWTVNGKGVLTLSNGDVLEGVFSGEWSKGLKVNGTYNRPDTEDTCTSPLHPPGCSGVCVADRWSCVFEEFWRRLGCALNGRRNRSNAWDSIAVTIATALKHSPDLSRHHRKALESLERIPQIEDKMTSKQYDDITYYLSKACASPLHPLGWLVETLVSVFRMSYLGLSNHRLLPSAVQEVKYCVSQLYSIVRFLFPGLPEENGDIRSPTTCPADSAQGGVSLLPLVLPGLYPPLFSLYCQAEDWRAGPVYWDRLLHLNNQPDQSLLRFLGVQPRFWPVTVSIQGERKEIMPSSKELCFWSAVESLRQISWKFCPSDKLLVIQDAIEQLTQDVKALLGSDYMWSMDDLFPLFLYVVVRARIKVLGAEVRLIEDLMDSSLKHGELELIFTTLKACHYHIQHEKTL